LATGILVCALSSWSVAAEEAPKPIGSIDDLPREARLALFEAQQQLEAGNSEKAVDILEKYVHDHAKKDDNFVMRYQYASMLVQVDRRQEALAEYERVVVLEPRYDAGWLGLGETAYGLGQYQRAADALRKGYETSAEKRPDVLYYSAAAQLLSGDAKGAVPVLENLVSGAHGAPKFEWYRGLVSACLQAGEPEHGREAVDQMLARFGTNPDAWYLAFHSAVSDSTTAVVDGSGHFAGAWNNCSWRFVRESGAAAAAGYLRRKIDSRLPPPIGASPGAEVLEAGILVRRCSVACM
jgi:pentatricopeptide repeat protein